MRGARASGDGAVAERVLHLADTEGIETIAEAWAGLPADSVAGCLWRLYLLRSWVYADPVGVAARVRRRACARRRRRRGRGRGRPARTRRAARDGRPGAARDRRSATSPTCSSGRPRSPGSWRPAGRAARTRTPRRGPDARSPTSSDRRPTSSSPASSPDARLTTPAARSDAVERDSLQWSSAPGRGSPGSQNQPLRAATRREALPVRRTSLLRLRLGFRPCRGESGAGDGRSPAWPWRPSWPAAHCWRRAVRRRRRARRRSAEPVAHEPSSSAPTQLPRQTLTFGVVGSADEVAATARWPRSSRRSTAR